jgi:hypothetical protein
MTTPPYQIVSCNWPHAASHRYHCWTGEPDWDFGAMLRPSQPRWELLDGEEKPTTLACGASRRRFSAGEGAFRCEM